MQRRLHGYLHKQEKVITWDRGRFPALSVATNPLAFILLGSGMTVARLMNVNTLKLI